jgi:ankyrin repeat protein
MVKKIFSSKLSFLASLLLAMLLVQCRCGASINDEQPAPQKNQDETITPITDEMIARARTGKTGISIDWEFLAKKLEALKDQNVVDINEHNGKDVDLSALHYAALLGATDMVQALLDRGGNPNTETKDGVNLNKDKVTPLHLAAEYGDDTMVRSLLDKGAKVNEKDGAGLAPLDAAFAKDPLPVKVIQLLVSKLSKDEINEKDGYGNRLLNKAFKRTDDKESKLLINILLSHPDIDVNMPDNNNNTLLHVAVHLGHIDIVKILLGKHANVNEKNAAGQTPLDIAFAQNPLPVAVIKLLVSKLSKDQINEKGRGENMFLHRALSRRTYEECKTLTNILVSHPDIDVNVLDNNNNTPLHLAVMYECEEVVKILLDKGARLDMKNAANQTLLELAEDMKNQEIIDLLKDHASKNP